MNNEPIKESNEIDHGRIIDFRSIVNTVGSYLDCADVNTEGLITQVELRLVYDFLTTHKVEFNKFLEREI